MSYETLLIPMNSSIDQDRVFLVYWILALCSSITIIFYFNRYVGFMISFLINKFLQLYLRYEIRIKVQSFKISFLGGRFFFKNFSIITKDYTLLVLQGSLTWRYWLRLPRKTKLELDDENLKNDSLASRFLLQIDGCEMFLYNRSVAYDNLMDFIKRSDATASEEINNAFEEHDFFSSDTSDSKNKAQQNNSLSDNEKDANTIVNVDNEIAIKNNNNRFKLFSRMDLFPISLTVKKGSLVIGNETTSSILVISYQSIDNGLIDLTKCGNKLDLHGIEYTMNLNNLKVSLTKNYSYKNTSVDYKTKKKHKNLQRFKKTKLYKILEKILFGNQKKKPAFAKEQEWVGLARYLGQDHSFINVKHHEIEQEEYARYTTILDSKLCNFNYYYDIPGFVPRVQEPLLESTDIGNSGSAPKTGITFELSHSTVHYGPWAHRERIDLHKMIFPSACRDAIPFSYLKPGSRRRYTEFNIKVDIKDDLVMRVPFRELTKRTEDHEKDLSKNNETLIEEEEKDVEEGKTKNSKRVIPFSWIDIKVSGGTYSSISTSYIPTAENGFQNNLNAVLIKPEIRTSINHDIFFQSSRHEIDCNLNFPLEWNGLTKWYFNNSSTNSEIFLLRDHIYLLSYLVGDFSAGAPPQYELFKPFKYFINWKFNSGYKIFLNINDSNIINNPLDFNDNVFLSIQGDSLDFGLEIPLDNILRKSTALPYSIRTAAFKLILDTPPWHTLNNFLKDNVVGHSENFVITGSYISNSKVDINAIDSISIDCNCENTVLQTYGFIIKYAMKIRENYFGDHKHFKTLDEYITGLNKIPSGVKEAFHDSYAEANASEVKSDNLNSAETNADAGSNLRNHHFLRIENELDVLFSFFVKKAAIILPSHLYNCDSFISLFFDTLDVDLRYTNYYMDFQANTSEVRSKVAEVTKSDTNFYDYVFEIDMSEPDLLINEGVSIHGHRMFGLPPVEPTYFCKWDFTTGVVILNDTRTNKFLSCMETCMNNLHLSRKDIENALLVDVPIIYDITVITFSCPSILLILDPSSEKHSKNPRLEITLSDISFDFNDFANDRYSKRINFKAPDISLKLVDKETGCLKGCLETTLIVTNFIQSQDFENKRNLQQTHIRINDAPFHRLPYFVEAENRNKNYNKLYKIIKPSIILPDLPPPLNSQSVDFVFEELPFFDDNYWDENSSEENPSTSESFKSIRLKNISSNLGNANTPDLKNKPSLLGENFPNFCFYSTSEFTPAYAPDPNYEYDNFIINLGSVKAFLAPSSLSVFPDLIDNLDSFTVENVMDSLQSTIITHLQNHAKLPSSVINIRFVSPTVDFKLGEFENIQTMDEVFDYNVENLKGYASHIDVKIVNPSLVASVKKTKGSNGLLGAMHKDAIEVEKHAALHIREVKIGLVKYERESDISIFAGDSYMLSFSLNDLEFWATSTIGITRSFNIRTLDVSLDSNNLIWIGNFLSKNINNFLFVFNELKSSSSNKKKSEVELLYSLSVASANYGVEHDPAVLTKPAYITRSSTSHIRSKDSWKVLTRLRHVLQNLPPEWLENTNKSFQTRSWEAPAESLNAVLDVFKRWRSWEFSDIEHCYVFKYVFDLPLVAVNEKKTYENSNLHFGIEGLTLRLIALDIEDDYVSIDYLALSVFIEREIFLPEFALLNMDDDTDRKGLNINVVFSLGSLRDKISPVIFKLKELWENIDITRHKPNSSSNASINHENESFEDQSPKKHVPMCLNVSCVIDKIFHKLKVDKTGLSITYNDLALTTLIITTCDLKNNLPFDVVLACDYMESEVFLNESAVLSHVIKESNIIFSSAGTLDEGLKRMEISSKELGFKCDQGTDEYILLVDTILDNELKFFDPLKEMKASYNKHRKPYLLPEISDDSSNSFAPKLLSDFIKFSFLVSFKVDQINWDIEVLSPLKFNGIIGGVSSQIHIVKDVLVSDIQFDSMTTNLISSKNGIETFLYAKTELSNLNLFAKALLSQDSSLFEVYIKSDSCILSIPKIIDTLTVAFKDKERAIDNVKKFENISDKIKNLVNTTKTYVDDNKLDEGKSKPIFTKFSNENKYSCLVTSLDNFTYRLDTRDNNLLFYNYSMSQMLHQIDKVSPFGEINLPSTRFSVSNSQHNIKELTVLDINLGLKIINPEKIEHALQTMQIEVNFCRLCLNPLLLVGIVKLVKNLTITVKSYRQNELKVTDNKSKAVENSVGSILSFFSIHILAYNICFGWIFSSTPMHDDDYPGVIIGCERIFVVTEKDVGKLTLIDAYLSLAHGSNCSNFYSNKSEFDSANRAFLPNVQASYAVLEVDSLKNVYSSVTGEQLDIKLESAALVFIEKTLKSIALAKENLESLQIFDTEATDFSKSNFSSQSDDSKIHSIACIMSFEGAKILIYSDDSGNIETSPSFFLHSPAVRTAVEYIRKPNSIKKHNIKTEILASSSKNTLYSTCVPIIVDIFHYVKKMIPSSDAKDEPQNVKTPQTTEDIDIGSLLSDFNINIGVRIEPQKLTLSCEPTAKVKVVASCSGIDLHFDTCEDTGAITGVFETEGLRASLQHIYSREISGSINLEELLISGIYDADKEKKIFTAGKITNVFSYINIKQLQDLDLFRDIWVPAAFYEEDVKTDVIQSPTKHSGNRNIAARAREVSKTGAFPWVITFMILNFNSKVDLGKSLGVVTLHMDRFSAISKKSISWEQNMKLAFDTITLVSEGRLGGEVVVKNFCVHTAISWKLNNGVFDIPLVLLSAGLDSLQAKASLDFHAFFIFNVENLNGSLFNQRDKTKFLHDGLYATINLDSIEIYFTALTASNFWDIYSTILRIRKDSEISYKEVLRDSATKKSEVMLNKIDDSSDSLSKAIEALKTELIVRIGRILVQVYPSSLFDSQVLLFKIGETKVIFLQDTTGKLESKLDLKLQDCALSLSNFKKPFMDENDIKSVSIDNFVRNSREAKGGTIFVFPSVLVDMDIWKSADSNIIEYIYHSSFGGKVDIRWNLGSVNFIREMWATHARALSTRLETYRRNNTFEKIEEESNSTHRKGSIFAAVNIEDKLKDVELDSKYVYVPVSTPIIEAPQLKELGDATPPLEWFGLHRQKFPDMTHQYIIISLQKMVNEVETQYERVLT